MLSQYKNINDLQFGKSFSAVRFGASDLVSYSRDLKYYSNTEILNEIDDRRIELHLYSNDTWLTGNHKVVTTKKIPSYVDKITNQTINIIDPIAIDLYSELKNLNLTVGKFTFAVNFFKNLIGSFEQQHLVIDEISTDRTEIRLRAIDPDNIEFLKQITNFIQTVNQTDSEFYTSYLLNFSRNQCFLFVNSVVVGEYVYIKLYEPLPSEYQVNFKCWIVEEQKPSYVDSVSIQTQIQQKKFNKLANPNWQANSIFNTSTDTGLKSWNELLAASTQTSQQIVDAYFSGSLGNVKLNIDYSDFNNFIFYSSATERLKNFRYKIQLIEYYSSQSLVVASISGSVSTTNQQDLQLLKNNLIGGFDDFEKYLYYQSSSKITTYDIPLETPTVPDLTGSYISPVPKSTSSYPYTLYSITSSNFISWFDGVYSSASLYDQSNQNSLIYTLPEYIRYDLANEQLLSFVYMLSQHYDILYTYINHMTKVNKREENPKLGMPNELLYSVAKQFGWNLTDGKQGQDLWTYVLGTDSTGTPLTGSNSVGDPSVPGKNQTYTIWRRIVNNLPLLLKSKGTKRSIRALLSCYGIPQSLISINEYGGPRLERAPLYEKLNFDYALDLSSSAAGTVIANYSQSINTVELRFRPDSVITNPLIPNTMNLFTIGSNTVTIDFTSGTKGVLQINGTGSSEMELYNDEWVTAMLHTSGSALELVAKKSKYGKIVAAVSASAAASFDYSGSITLGSTTGGSRFVGQLQELRLWSSSLQDAPFDNHVKAPGAYDGNVDAYSELVFRLPLNQKINHTLTSSLSGIQPVSSNITASFVGWSLNTPYDSIEETYYYDAISLGAGTFDDNKIRLEDNELIGTLDVKTRAERSQFDRAPLDSKKLGVYFSPQTMIDEDIIAQLGFISLDEYIGDPSSTQSKSYPELIQIANDYWKKYQTRNNINSYIKMFTLFDLSFFKQLEQLLPARADKITGLLIQPNILERSKDTILPVIKRYDSTYSAIITQTQPTASGDYLQYLGAIDGNILSITAQDDDQWQMYLTASQSEKYDGVTYSYQYLIRSGSTYITASTPYWLSEGLCPAITGSTWSEITQYKIILNNTESYHVSQFSDYIPRGVDNQRYSGAKISSPGFNVASTQTVDGGPVVEWRTANPNQLIYQTNGEQGSFRLA